MAMSYRHVSVLLPKPPHNQSSLFIVNNKPIQYLSTGNKHYKKKKKKITTPPLDSTGNEHPVTTSR